MSEIKQKAKQTWENLRGINSSSTEKTQKLEIKNSDSKTNSSDNSALANNLMNNTNEIPVQIPLPVIRPKFRENPRILEPNRVATKEPLKYEKSPSNLLDMFKQILPSQKLEDYGFATKTFKLNLKSNTRIIIDGIDFRDITTGQIVKQRHLEIYRKEQGYLVAKKIVNGKIETKGTFNLTENSSENNSTANILKSAKYGNLEYTKDEPPHVLYNYHKQQEHDGTMQLVSTTYQSPIAYEDVNYGGIYQSMEISVSTPNDRSDQIEITFDTHSTSSHTPLSEFICIREVEEK